MKEKQLCTEIVRSINLIPQSWAYKIPDSSPRHIETESFRPARAFDITACIKGRYYAIEVKMIKGTGGLSKDRFTEFEIRSLVGVVKGGGSAVVAIGREYTSDCIVYTELHLLPISRWYNLTKRLVGTKTVKINDILSNSIEIGWGKNGIWKVEEGLYQLQRKSIIWKVGEKDETWKPFKTRL
jgi:penicillin-binding protein-related factor A (putative recombinase)